MSPNPTVVILYKAQYKEAIYRSIKEESYNPEL